MLAIVLVGEVFHTGHEQTPRRGRQKLLKAKKKPYNASFLFGLACAVANGRQRRQPKPLGRSTIACEAEPAATHPCTAASLVDGLMASISWLASSSDKSSGRQTPNRALT
jgi:hypothetical protein